MGHDFQALTERVAWWAEIFETPCVACAGALPEARALKEAGADFVALGEAIFGSSSPAAAAREAQALIASEARCETAARGFSRGSAGNQRDLPRFRPNRGRL